MDIDSELDNGCPQDEMGRRTHLTNAAKTGWNAVTVAQQTACHQLVSAVASAMQALQRFQDGNGPRPPVLAPEGPGTQKM